MEQSDSLEQKYIDFALKKRPSKYDMKYLMKHLVKTYGQEFYYSGCFCSMAERTSYQSFVKNKFNLTND